MVLSLALLGLTPGDDAWPFGMESSASVARVRRPRQSGKDGVSCEALLCFECAPSVLCDVLQDQLLAHRSYRHSRNKLVGGECSSHRRRQVMHADTHLEYMVITLDHGTLQASYTLLPQPHPCG